MLLQSIYSFISKWVKSLFHFCSEIGLIETVCCCICNHKNAERWYFELWTDKHQVLVLGFSSTAWHRASSLLVDECEPGLIFDVDVPKLEPLELLSCSAVINCSFPFHAADFIDNSTGAQFFLPGMIQDDMKDNLAVWHI